MHHSQPFGVRETFFLNRRAHLIVGGCKSDAVKPFIDAASILCTTGNVPRFIYFGLYFLLRTSNKNEHSSSAAMATFNLQADSIEISNELLQLL